MKQKYCRVANALFLTSTEGALVYSHQEKLLSNAAVQVTVNLCRYVQKAHQFFRVTKHIFYSRHPKGILPHHRNMDSLLTQNRALGDIQFLWGHLSTDEVKDKSQVKLLLTKKSIGYFTTKLENKTKGERGEQQLCQGIPKTHLCCLLLHMNFPWNSWELPWPQSLQKDTTKLPFTLYHSSQQATFLIIILP